MMVVVVRLCLVVVVFGCSGLFCFSRLFLGEIFWFIFFLWSHFIFDIFLFFVLLVLLSPVSFLLFFFSSFLLFFFSSFLNCLFFFFSLFLPQLLARTVKEERPDLATEKERLIVESAENARQLKKCEDTILHILSASEGNILEDQSAIEALNSSKVVSDTIKEKQEIADKTELEIDAIRMQYVPVAYRGT
jgi:hypothetical protein